MLIYLNTVTKRIFLAYSTLVVYLGMTTIANAQLPLAYRFVYIKLTTHECLQRGLDVFKDNGLSPSSAVINEENQPFVVGVNSKFTAIFDCTEAAKIGRVTVMVTSVPGSGTADLDFSGTLLNKFKTFHNSHK